jgi:hypothetical protein
MTCDSFKCTVCRSRTRDLVDDQRKRKQRVVVERDVGLETQATVFV